MKNISGGEKIELCNYKLLFKKERMNVNVTCYTNVRVCCGRKEHLVSEGKLAPSGTGS